MSLFARTRQHSRSALVRLVTSAAVLILALVLGFLASSQLLGLLAVGLGAAVVIQYPPAGLVALTIAALFVPIMVRTGTAVALNPAAVLVPVLMALWVLDMVRRGEVSLVPSRVNRPLILFLLAGLLSLLIGNALWDPAVPRPAGFTLIQLAQWAIFFFSAGAFWLTGNLIREQATLRRLTLTYLALCGLVVVLFTFPQFLFGSAEISRFVNTIVTFALHRAPFWLLLASIAGGQLLFNEELSTSWRLFLLFVLGGVLIYVLHLMRGNASNWIGVAAAAGVLVWLRFPRLRWPVILLLAVLAVSGVLSSSVYEFAGGDLEWERSGGSRLVLIGRVLEVSLRNPVTGLGPVAYRLYAPMKPLQYGLALWNNPVISSHNNYVDLFSYVGILGLALFLWFGVEVARTGLRLRARFRRGFAAGYVNGILAAGAGALILMLLADWILPSVYNIGFAGFQASILVWMFFGGLIALEQMVDPSVKNDPDVQHRRQVGHHGAS